MATGNLPYGTKGNVKYATFRTGDILLLADGSKIVFNELKRVKWNGRMLNEPSSERRTIVPIWRDRLGTTPFIVEKIGFEEPDKKPIVKASNLKFGDLFYLVGHKETFFYVSLTTKRTGKVVVKGIDLASKRVYSIEASMAMIKVDMKAITELANTTLAKID